MIKFKIGTQEFAKVVNKMAPGMGSYKIENTVVENKVRCSLYKQKKDMGTLSIFDGNKQIFVPFLLEELEMEKKETTFYLSGKELASLAKVFETQETLMEFSIDKDIVCKCANSTLKLKTSDPVPMMEPDKNNILFDIEIKKSNLEYLLKKGGFAYGKTSILENVCLVFGKDKVSVFSSDGLKAAMSYSHQITLNNSTLEEINVLLLGNHMHTILRVFDEDKIKIQISKRQIMFISPTCVAILLPSEGNFPLSVITGLFENREGKVLEVNVGELRLALAILNVVLKEQKGRPISFEMKGNKLSIETEGGIGEKLMDATLKGGEIKKFWISGMMLEEIINSMDDKKLVQFIIKKEFDQITIVEKGNEQVSALLCPIKAK